MNEAMELRKTQINTLATQLMGWKENGSFGWTGPSFQDPKRGASFRIINERWNPFEDVKSAFDVMEKLRADGSKWLIECNMCGQWYVEVREFPNARFKDHGKIRMIETSLPKAICMAALCAMKALNASPT